MVEITYQVVLSTLQTAGILVGIAYYVMNLNYTRRNQEISLRNQEQTLKSRHAAIFDQITSPLRNPQGLRSLSLLESNPVSSHDEWLKLISENEEFYEAWLWVCFLYEMFGIYFRKGVADIEYFVMLQPFWGLRFWRQAKPIIYKQREGLGPSYFRNMEFLFDSLEKYFEEHPELAP
jgi:hypothetical protein